MRGRTSHDGAPRDALDTPTLDAVRRAASRIEGAVARTPVLRSPELDRLSGRALFFKAECLQTTGSFKLRGALNAVLLASATARAVVTHSSGNHARALAYAARLAGLAAHMVMPRDAPPEKIAAVRAEGASLTLCEPTPEARLQTALRVQSETGAALIPPSDHCDVMAGQGTVALEFVAQAPGLDAIVVPVGGGGLLAGVALTLASLCPTVRVWGAEPIGADDAARSKSLGRHLPPRGPARTVADGLRTPLVARAWPTVRDRVEGVVTVSDDDTLRALVLLHTHLGVWVEPSAAIGLAAVLATPSLTGRVGVVLTGGNRDSSRLARERA